MKRTSEIIVVMLVLTIAFAGYVYASPVAQGDLVTFISYDSGYDGNYLFRNDTQGDTNFATFCLEKDEYINYGNQYTVTDVSLWASAGGNGYDETDGVSSDSRDYISDATKWLFYNFLEETLTVSSVSDFNNANGISALQDAFWYLENEITAVSGLSSDLVNAANAAVSGDTDVDFGNVRVMNIVDSSGNYAQSQLVTAPVPEPATMVLLGTGLIGLAFYRRKMKK